MDIKDKETNKKKNSCCIETIKNTLCLLAILLGLLIIIPIHLVSIKGEGDLRKVQANNNETFECIAGPDRTIGSAKFSIVKDKETGVEYIVVKYDNAISIIPRLKGDEIKYGYYSE